MHFSNTPAPRPSGLLRVASVNVNGIRAAYKKDMAAWLASRDIDILCLQEVRAPDAIVRELLDESQWHILHAEAAAKGRAGVLVATRRTPNSAGEVLENQPVATRSNIGTQKQDDKYRFLERMLVRMPELAKHSDHVLIVGDLNVGHTELDIKNWKANQKRAGFLPEERAYFDRFFGDIGYRDVARELAGQVPGPYTWWSYRGKAFDNDAGWRIDYHMATPALAESAVEAVVDRAASYDERFSDHAPLVVDYRIGE